MADYSKAKKLHPNLKVRNAKALIAEIRRAEWSPGSGALPPARTGDGSPLREPIMRMDGSLTVSGGGGKYPIYFDMCEWLQTVESNQHDDDSVCGTAACIAGFAYVLTFRQEAIRGIPHDATIAIFRKWRREMNGHWVYGMVMILAKFLGVDYATAKRMSSLNDDMGFTTCIDDSDSDVEPRHAVAMLEHFLETGKVDWNRAMGRQADGALTRAEDRRRHRARDALRMRIEEAA